MQENPQKYPGKVIEHRFVEGALFYDTSENIPRRGICHNMSASSGPERIRDVWVAATGLLFQETLLNYLIHLKKKDID